MSHTECTRCKATTQGGSQCSRTTCKYSDMCYQHTKSDKSLKATKSIRMGEEIYVPYGTGYWK